MCQSSCRLRARDSLHETIDAPGAVSAIAARVHRLEDGRARRNGLGSPARAAPPTGCYLLRAAGSGVLRLSRGMAIQLRTLAPIAVVSRTSLQRESPPGRELVSALPLVPGHCLQPVAVEAPQRCPRCGVRLQARLGGSCAARRASRTRAQRRRPPDTAPTRAGTGQARRRSRGEADRPRLAARQGRARRSDRRGCVCLAMAVEPAEATPAPVRLLGWL
jgi:hypothetical protein